MKRKIVCTLAACSTQTGFRRGWLTALIALLAVSVFAPCAFAQGYPDKPVRLVVGFIAAFVPAKTPRTIVQRLSQEFQKPLRNKDFVAGLLAVGVDSAPSSPEELRSFVSVQSRKWGDMVRSAGIAPE